MLAFVAGLMSAVALYSTLKMRKANGQLKQLQRYASKLKTSQLALKKHAFYDPLTGLANRLLLMDRFQIAVQHAKRNQQQFAVLMVDLNKFKAINDTYGHATGDTVLITVAKRLTASVRASDTVARLGGDEFVLIIQSIESADQAMYFCKTSGLMPLV